MPRKGIVILLLAVVVLSAANVLVFVRGRGAAVPATTGPIPTRQRWQALPAAERLAYVQRYQSMARRGDSAAVLPRARRFSRLSPERQECLRSLHRALQKTLAEQTSARRRDVLRRPPRARAFFVYQTLVKGDPQRVAELAAQLQEAP